MNKNIPLPKKNFSALYKGHESVVSLMQDPEWQTVFSHYYHFDRYEQEIITETIEETELYDLKKQQQEFIKCAKSFAYFCHKYIKIAHPKYGLIPFCLFKYQKKTIEAYEANRFNILSKFRQGGLTTVTVNYALWKCMFDTDQQIMVMSKTDREAIAAGEIAKRALEYLPTWLRPRMSKNNDHEKQFDDTGSSLRFFTPEAARGKSCSIIVVDEAAFIPDMESHWKAMYPVISTGGSCFIISTVNGVGNWYEETYTRAIKKKNEFNVIELDYWEHPEYNDPKWVEDTRKNLGEKGWQQEVLRSFLGSGSTFIDPKYINELDERIQNTPPIRVLFPKWTRSDDNEEQKGALWIWKEPLEGHEYILAADCAEGISDEGDNSCFEILDVNTLEQVAEFYSNNIKLNEFAETINQLGNYYNTALVIIENKTPGTAVLNSLQTDIGYDNLYIEYKNKKQSVGVRTGKDNRPMFLTALQNRIMDGTLTINSKRFVNELKTFIFNPITRRAEAQKGKHDDTIIPISMALFIREKTMQNDETNLKTQNTTSNVFKKELITEIQREINKGLSDEWITEQEASITMSEEEWEVLRPHDKILKEFGW